MAPSSGRDWPEWWEWELGFTPHSEERMEQRGLSEVDLRRMLEDATEIVASRRPGRWIARTRYQDATWNVVSEPDSVERLVMIVTAYPRTTAT